MAADWWCSGYKHPSTVRFELTYGSARDASGRFTEIKYEIRLLKLTVHGKPASAMTVQKIRELTAPLQTIRNLSGRCLRKRDGGTTPILRFDGYTAVGAALKLDLDLDRM
jgi:hypothetical protein